MWFPFSWIIKHWGGIFHSVVRTGVVLILWYTFPEYRFVVIPFATVFIYTAIIVILINRSTVK